MFRDSAGFHTNGVVKNLNAAVYLYGTDGGSSYVPSIQRETGLASASATLSADAGHQSLDVSFAGNSSTNRWVVTVKGLRFGSKPITRRGGSPLGCRPHVPQAMPGLRPLCMPKTDYPES